MKFFARILLTILLTESVANAEIRDTLDYQSCFKKCAQFPDWEQFVLISEDTLKAIDKDAEAYKKLFPELQKIQDEINEKIAELNAANQKIYNLEVDLSKMSQEKFMLEHPPWYKQPGTMFIVGGAVTFAVLTAVAIVVVYSFGGLRR